MNFIITVAWALLWQINLQALKKGPFDPFCSLKSRKVMHVVVQSLVVEPKKVCRVDKYQERIPSYYVHNLNYTWSWPCSLSLNKVSNSDSRSYFLTISNWSPFLHLPQECCKVHSTACPHLKNGKSNYTQGGHVRAHMLEKCTPSSGRISSSRCWPLSVCRHTPSVQPQGQLSQGEIEREIG